MQPFFPRGLDQSATDDSTVAPVRLSTATDDPVHGAAGKKSCFGLRMHKSRSVDQSGSRPSFVEHAVRARSVDMCHTILQPLSPSAKQVCVWHVRLHALTTW